MAKKKSSAKAVEEPIEERKVEEKVEGQEEDLEAEIMADLEGLESENPVPIDAEENTKGEVLEEPIEAMEEEPKETAEFTEEDPNEEANQLAEGQLEKTDVTPEETEMDEVAREEVPVEGEAAEISEEIVGEDSSTAEGEEELTPPADDEEDEDEGEELPPIGEATRESQKVDEHTRLKNVVEAALFVAGRPLSMEELNTKTNIGKRDLETCLNELMMDYLERPTALEIIQIQDKFSLQIKPEYTSHAKKFTTGGLIPDAILKTLTIVALKQPLLKSTLIKIRGAGAYDHVKFLLDRGFVKSQKKGRSDELMTTEQFADTFGLARDINTLKKQLIAQLGIPEAPSGPSE
jgi:segregation and condensation protein B